MSDITRRLIALRSYAEHHFSTILALSFILGLVFPSVGVVPSYVAPSLLAMMMLFSCSRIHLNELKRIRIQQILSFYIARFWFLPFVLYSITLVIRPDFSNAVLMMCLLPTGLMAPAVSAILGGNVSLAIGGVILSNILAPFVITGGFALIGSRIELDLVSVFMTLSAMILLPLVLYFALLRRIEPVKQTLRANAPVASTLLISTIIFLIVSSKRDMFLSNSDLWLICVALSFSGFCVFYALGWFGYHKHDRSERVGYSLMAGVSNVGLGISLAYAFLPEKDVLFMVLVNVPWIGWLILFRRLVRRHNMKNEV